MTDLGIFSDGEEVDVWSVQAGSSETASEDPHLIVQSVAARIDAWMHSPVGDFETLDIKVQYRSVDRDKAQEWRDSGML
jgi:hypothetical protein